jgi:cellulose synthase/poly-beta-1,6-N-acetylglucosamine synthase-like glycosyltransferase
MVTDGRTISLALTNYNRTDLLLEAFYKVRHDDRISEIVVSDDHSHRHIYDELKYVLSGIPKVKLFRNEKNVDCYQNKKMAVERATNDWVILLDSDNVIGVDFLDRLYSVPGWEDRTVYAPSFARPTFDYRHLCGVVSGFNVKSFLRQPMSDTCLNTANFFVNRQTYLSAWDENIDPVTADSIYMNYRLLSAGNEIHILSGLEYEHKVHEGSHYKNNVHKTPSGLYEQILDLLKELS